MTPKNATVLSARWPWAGQPLHVRAALVALPLLAALGTTMFFLLRHHSAQAALEAGQRMNQGLAQYVVDHQAPGLIDARGEPDRARMKALALHVMMINPQVEMYLLNGQGRVLAHALEGLQGADPVGRDVGMAPVLQLLDEMRAGVPRLPVLADDPRNPGRFNTFSVAPVVSDPPDPVRMGYLYIVLNGHTAQTVAASLSNSDALRAIAIGVAAATATAAFVLWLALRKLTQPLRRLTGEVLAFREEDERTGLPGSGDEIAALQTAVRAMQQRIAQQFQRLEDGDRQRRELVSNISHDLRTPLSNIQGYLETVLLRGDQIAPADRAAHLRTALRHVDLLGKRVADLFELSKLDAGRVQPQHEVFCLAELLQDVVQDQQLAAQQREVRLGLAAGSHTQARVRADIALIERVLQNLIDNALRHTAAGGEVTLAIETRGAFLEISVSDTGRGIASEHLPHIFERYWRADDGAADSAHHAAPGASAGLGLAIVKRILDLHGSAVQVRSELMRGTRFEFLLPRAA